MCWLLPLCQAGLFDAADTFFPHRAIAGRKITREFGVPGSDSFGENNIHLVKAFNLCKLLSDVTSGFSGGF